MDFLPRLVRVLHMGLLELPQKRPPGLPQPTVRQPKGRAQAAAGWICPG